MSVLDDLPPLREVVATHGLAAQKALGQNFLFDLNITAKIARLAGPLEGFTVFEVGPGPGGLTRALLAAGADRVIAIERDPRCLPALDQIARHWPGRLTVIEGDALKTDVRSLASGAPTRIVANLPYNIGTELLTGWLTENPTAPFWTSLTLMFQKEVGQRIIAAPGTNHYGRLGVLCGWLTDAEILFDLPPQAFNPPPKVTSSVVHLTPKKAPLPCNLRTLEKVTAAAFGQRRKMLRQSLKGIGGEALLERAGIDPSRRAETLDIDEFVALANLIEPSGQ